MVQTVRRLPAGSYLRCSSQYQRPLSALACVCTSGGWAKNFQGLLFGGGTGAASAPNSSLQVKLHTAAPAEITD